MDAARSLRRGVGAEPSHLRPTPEGRSRLLHPAAMDALLLAARGLPERREAGHRTVVGALLGWIRRSAQPVEASPTTLAAGDVTAGGSPSGFAA